MKPTVNVLPVVKTVSCLFRKLIEIALDQNGAESAETHDLRSGFDRAGRRASNAGEVVAQVGGIPGGREE